MSTTKPRPIDAAISELLRVLNLPETPENIAKVVTAMSRRRTST